MRVLYTSKGTLATFVIPRASTDELVFADQLEIKAVRWPSPAAAAAAGGQEQKLEMRTLHDLRPSPDADGLLVNDGKCDRRGRLWFGTVDPKWLQPDVQADIAKNGLQESGRAAVHCVDPLAIAKSGDAGSDFNFDVGLMRKVTDGMYVSNGIGWSPDDRNMYFVDTTAKVVHVFDYDVVTGEAGVCRSGQNTSSLRALLSYSSAMT